MKFEKQYPHTQAVSEQIEELRDTLHIKTEEYHDTQIAHRWVYLFEKHYTNRGISRQKDSF